MKLIGLNGYKRSGKNTVGSIIASRRDAVRQVGLADKMKVAAARALGFDRTEQALIDLMDSFKEVAVFDIRYLEPGDNSPHHHEFTGRQYLQWFGTEAGRQTFSNDFWIDLVLPRPGSIHESLGRARRELEARYPDTDILVVTDVRFLNEAVRVKALGGVVWEVVRPGVVGGGHVTEEALPDYVVDDVIVNNSTLEDLEQRVEEALVRLGC